MIEINKPLPYVSGTIAIFLGMFLSFILYSTTNIVTLFSMVLPAPLTLNPLAAFFIFGLLLAILIKLSVPFIGKKRQP